MLETALFKARNLRAVVVDLDFRFLYEYLENLSPAAPMILGKGMIDLVLVFTERCLPPGLSIEEARARKEAM